MYILLLQISIPLTQYEHTMPSNDGKVIRKIFKIFYGIADILLCIHFTLDPYIYVILRRRHPHFGFFKPLCRMCWTPRSRSNSLTGYIFIIIFNIEMHDYRSISNFPFT